MELSKNAHIENPVSILQRPLTLLNTRKCQFLIIVTIVRQKSLKQRLFNPPKMYVLCIEEVIMNIHILRG